MMSTILITGAAGFIGSHLVERLLDKGHRVVGLDNLCDVYSPSNKRRNLAAAEGHPHFTFVQTDIRDRGALQNLFGQVKPDLVVHLAAMAGVRPSIKDPQLYSDVNVTGTVNVLDATVACGSRHVVFASSSSIYGNNEKVPFSETDVVDHPISPYAATKKACELIAHSYHHLHQISIVCLRFFTVYGPRQRPDLAISQFLRRLVAGQSITRFGDGSTSRDYTYIDDILAGVCAAIGLCQCKCGYWIYNLGHDSPVTLQKLIRTVEEVTGLRAQVEEHPMQPGDVQRTWADLSRARRELGYSPCMSLVDGIRRQWDWLQRHQP